MKERQAEIQEIQLNNPKAFGPELKAEYDNNTKELKSLKSRLSIVEEALKQNAVAAKPAATAVPGEVQVRVVYGNRYSARTGKEINHPTVRSFSFGEWQLFKQAHKLLGYVITEVINDPYGDAAALVEKTEG